MECLRQDGQNRIAIALIYDQEKLCSLTPCCVTVDLSQLHRWNLVIDVPQECQSLYFSMPDYVTPSDIFVLRRIISEKKEERPLVFVVSKTSELTKEIIGQAFPNSRIVVAEV